MARAERIEYEGAYYHVMNRGSGRQAEWGQGSEFQGYLLDIQCDLLDGLNTRVVVPLMSIQSAPMPAERLNPIFTIKTKQYVMVTHFLSSIPISILKTPVGNIESHHDEIVSAVDMLIHGF